MTNAASALREKISMNENPRWRASHSEMRISPAVITALGQAFSAHCPCHAICSEENGFKYGMGH